MEDLYTEVIIPESVHHEFSQELPPYCKIISSQNISLVLLLRDKLGYGESEVIALGVEKKDHVLVLDDLKARQTAKRLNLKVTGLLGILIKAKQINKIAAIKPFLMQLERENFHISQALKDQVLSMVGE